MDTSSDAGEELSSGCLFRYVDLRGHSASYVCHWLSYSKPVAFAELAKAISRGNSSIESAILRVWGIRREDVQAALSCGVVRFSDVPGWSDFEGCSDVADDGTEVLRPVSAGVQNVERSGKRNGRRY